MRYPLLFLTLAVCVVILWAFSVPITATLPGLQNHPELAFGATSALFASLGFVGLIATLTMQHLREMQSRSRAEEERRVDRGLQLYDEWQSTAIHEIALWGTLPS
jgi:hypothetical protein